MPDACVFAVRKSFVLNRAALCSPLRRPRLTQQQRGALPHGRRGAYDARMSTLLLLLLSVFPLQGQGSAATVQQGRALIQKGDFAGAEQVFRQVTTASASNAVAWSLLGYCLHAQGKLDEALVVHEKAATFPQTRATACYNAACVHALRSETDEAIAWLGKAVKAGFSNRQLLLTDTDLAGIRNDPRFQKLLPPLLSGAQLFVEKARVLTELVGEAAGDQYGWVARNMGDLDGDEVDDFAATAPTRALGGPAAGRVYVYSSKTGKLLFQCDGKPGWRLGNSVAGGFDANGDGTPDIVAGAPFSGAAAGRALVYSGKDGATLLELSAGEVGDSFGVKVCGIEDLNGDDCSEIAVGAMKADAKGRDSGRVYVYSGKDGEPLFQIDGQSAGDQFGSSIDATHSGGHRLLVVGAMKDDGVGRCSVYRCEADGAEPAFTIEPDATAKNLGQYFVTILGDVDGDEVPDVYASDWNNAAGGQNTGRVYVHSGRSGERILTLTGTRPGEGAAKTSSFAPPPRMCWATCSLTRRRPLRSWRSAVSCRAPGRSTSTFVGLPSASGEPAASIPARSARSIRRAKTSARESTASSPANFSSASVSSPWSTLSFRTARTAATAVSGGSRSAFPKARRSRSRTSRTNSSLRASPFGSSLGMA